MHSFWSMIYLCLNIRGTNHPILGVIFDIHFEMHSYMDHVAAQQIMSFVDVLL